MTDNTLYVLATVDLDGVLNSDLFNSFDDALDALLVNFTDELDTYHGDPVTRTNVLDYLEDQGSQVRLTSHIISVHV